MRRLGMFTSWSAAFGLTLGAGWMLGALAGWVGDIARDAWGVPPLVTHLVLICAAMAALMTAAEELDQ